MDDFALYMHRMHWHATTVDSVWFIVILALLFAFELWMLVDCIKNKKVPTDHKVWWIVGIFLIHPFVAIAYFFASRFHYNKLKSAKS